jgi:hypothetical protein
MSDGERATIAFMLGMYPDLAQFMSRPGSQNGPEIDDFSPFFIGFVVGVGCRMMILGPRLGTFLSTLASMPMCA